MSFEVLYKRARIVVAVSVLLLAGAQAQGGTIQIKDATGAPGQTIDVTVELTPSGGESVAGTQNDFFYDAAIFSIAPNNEGKPDCIVNDAINKKIDGSLTFGFGFLKKAGSSVAACDASADTCNGVRAIVLSTDNVDAITLPLLYTCKVKAAAGAALGPYTLSNENVILSDPQGQRVAGPIAGGGTITLGEGGGTACACDCNKDGRVSGGEVTRCVNILGALAELSTCTAADSNKDTRVTGGDITRGVAALGAGTSCQKF